MTNYKELSINEDLNNHHYCWVCNTLTKERFCSDKCEQQYVEDMEAQGENINGKDEAL